MRNGWCSNHSRSRNQDLTVVEFEHILDNILTMSLGSSVYYNCAKFHLNQMSRLGGVVLTNPSLHTERISEYKLNDLPFQILDSNHIPSCTSAGSVLQLCKVS